jgi:predicted Holliday junction resolvase-like endonuclease
MRGQIAEQFARFLARLSSGPKGLRSGFVGSPVTFWSSTGWTNRTSLILSSKR